MAVRLNAHNKPMLLSSRRKRWGQLAFFAVSLSVGFSTQEKAMDVARSAPQGAHYLPPEWSLLSLNEVYTNSIRDLNG